MKCKAAITDGRGNFMIDEIEVAEPAADEVLVKIKAAGICHTDHDSLDFPDIIDHYENKKLLLEQLVTKKYYLSQLDQAFDDLLNGKNAKGVIEFN